MLLSAALRDLRFWRDLITNPAERLIATLQPKQALKTDAFTGVGQGATLGSDLRPGI